MPHKIIKLKSPSKINLALWIKEKRPDGYHEIETIFYENENLYDEIEIEFTESNSLSVEISFIQDKLNKLISKNENLAYKAALLFFEKLNVKGICRIKINKNILPYLKSIQTGIFVIIDIVEINVTNRGGQIKLAL